MISPKSPLRQELLDSSLDQTPPGRWPRGVFRLNAVPLVDKWLSVSIQKALLVETEQAFFAQEFANRGSLG